MALSPLQQKMIQNLADQGVTDIHRIISWCQMYLRLPAYPKKNDYGATRRYAKSVYQGIIEALT